MTQTAQSIMDAPVTVTLPRWSWLVVLGAADDFDARVPREQGDGGSCLDTIRAALDDQFERWPDDERQPDLMAALEDSLRERCCTCGDGSAEEDRGAVLRCVVHGIGVASDQEQGGS